MSDQDSEAREASILKMASKIEGGRDRWGEEFDTQDELTNTRNTSELVEFKTLEYEAEGFTDEDLWDAYREDFKTFTLQTFQNCNQTYLRKLRIVLREYGVWVATGKRVSLAEALYQTLQEEDPTEWDEVEIRACMAKGIKFKSGLIN
jgi:hypothetical protein